MKQQPNEKARELVEKFEKLSHSDWHPQTGYDKSQGYENAKQCALIACDEKLESLHPWKNTYSGRKQIEEIQSVKQLINDL